MRLSSLFLCLTVVLLTLASSCKQPVRYSAINTSSRNKLNDAARFLAGMSADSFTAIPYYKSYCDSMDAGFGSTELHRNAQMRNWAKTELPQDTQTVFYPFSGPDILNCVQFFPDAKEYILMALERYGSLPMPEALDSIQLHCIYRSLSDLFDKGYFVTRKMVTDVSNPHNGVIPIACLSLARSGYSILDIKYKHLQDDGETFEEVPQDSLGTKLNDCVEIYFRKNGKDRIQKLIYFKTNLADDAYGVPDYFNLNTAYNPNNIPGLKTNKGLKAYLDNLPVCSGYLKSASYLMFQGHFSIIRRLCLDHCELILQDDTGIPFSSYDKNKWAVTLFGRYEKPISIFHGGYFQAALDSTYRVDSATIKSLPFSLGYHFEDSVQNLMKFEKK